MDDVTQKLHVTATTADVSKYNPDSTLIFIFILLCTLTLDNSTVQRGCPSSTTHGPKPADW